MGTWGVPCSSHILFFFFFFFFFLTFLIPTLSQSHPPTISSFPYNLLHSSPFKKPHLIHFKALPISKNFFLSCKMMHNEWKSFADQLVQKKLIIWNGRLTNDHTIIVVIKGVSLALVVKKGGQEIQVGMGLLFFRSIPCHTHWLLKDTDHSCIS